MFRNRFVIRKMSFLVVSLCFLVLGTSLVCAQNSKRSGANVVLAIGTSKVADGNLALAKELAISRALTKGVENYLSDRLKSQGMVNNFEKIIQEIIPKAEEHIENFHILTEILINDTFNILVRLKVNEKVLDRKFRAAGFVFKKGPPIKVLFLVSETMNGNIFFWWEHPEFHSAMNATELALYNVFKGRGFNPVNRASNLPQMEYLEDLKAFELQEKDLLKWGELLSADVVIYGGTEFAGQKELSLKLTAFDVSQHVQIVQGMQVEEMTAGPDTKRQMVNTINNLVNKLSDRLISTIIRVSSTEHERIHQVVITLKGVSSYGQFRLFRDFLKADVKGIESVRQSRVRKDSISAIVKFQGEIDSIIAGIMNNEGLPFSLDLVQVDKKIVLFKIK